MLRPIPSQIAGARRNPGGWVYQCDPQSEPSLPIPPDAVQGAWKVDAYGNVVGEFVPNPSYRGRQAQANPYGSSNVRMDAHPPPRPATSSQDTAAAFLIVIMLLATGGGLYVLLSNAIHNQVGYSSDRFHLQAPTPYAPFSFLWWAGVVTCTAAFLYCCSLLVQLLRKQA